MNHFSDKEYHLLKTEALDNKNSISRYIGYIITVTGVSGLIKFYFDNTVGPTGSIILFFLTLVVLTLLFEVVWYKFKSHNRLIGYIQVLMQEIDAIPYNKVKRISKKGIVKRDDFKDKKYINNWKTYGVTKDDKLLNDFYAWEFAMARYHENVLFEKNNQHQVQERIDDYCEAIDKGNYIFSLPNNWMPYTEKNDGVRKSGEICDRDVEFLESIILPIYFENNALSLKGMGLFKYLGFLLRDKSKSEPLKQLDVENRYLVYGWEYPRKITQIAFIAASLIFVFLTMFLITNFEPVNPFNETKNLDNIQTFSHVITRSLPIIFFIASFGIMVFWIKRYVKGLVDLLYGKFSINYYSWQFFVYRIQMLNNKSLIPVFYSRAYLRYFKCKTYHKFLTINESDIITIIEGKENKKLEDYIKFKNKSVSVKKVYKNQKYENRLRSILETHYSQNKPCFESSESYSSFLNSNKHELVKYLASKPLGVMLAYKEHMALHKQFMPNSDIGKFHIKFKQLVKAKMESNSKLNDSEKEECQWYNLTEQLSEYYNFNPKELEEKNEDS